MPTRRDIFVGGVVALGMLAMILAMMHGRLPWSRSFPSAPPRLASHLLYPPEEVAG